MNYLVPAVLFLVCIVSLTFAWESVDCKFKNGKGVSPKKGIRRPDTLSPVGCKDKCIELMSTEKKITGMSYDIEDGCYCLKEMRWIDESKKYEKFISCHLQKNEPNVMNNVNKVEQHAGAAVVDLTYNYFKNTECDETWTKIGCYDVTEENRGRYLLNYTKDIEWEPTRFPKFAQSFVCACAEAARMNHVQYFATHNNGECWELEQEDLVAESEGCQLADGHYKTKCGGINEDGTCLGTSGYFVYTTMPPDADEKKKREVEEKDLLESLYIVRK